MVIFHYLIKTENSQGTFCQQRVLIKNASGRLGMFRESLLQKCIVFILTNSELADFQFLKKERRVLIFLQTNSSNKHKEALVRDIETV